MKDLHGLLTIIVLVTTILYFFGLVWWKIFARAGHRGALGLLMLVPVVNLVMPCVLAFGEWPVHRQLAHARKMLPTERRSVFDD